jgi:hypothetical protein
MADINANSSNGQQMTAGLNNSEFPSLVTSNVDFKANE